MTARPECAVVGDAVLDEWVLGDPAGECREAPAPAAVVTSRVQVPGGAANAAVNVRALGVSADLLTVVGEDAAGDALVDACAADGVGVDGVRAESGRATLVRRRFVVDGRIVLRLDEGTEVPAGPGVRRILAERLRTDLGRMDGLLVSDRGYGALPPGDAGDRRDLADPRAVVVCDARDLAAHAALRPSVATPSYHDAVRAAGARAQAGVGERVAQLCSLSDELLTASGAGSVAVTLGGQGAVLIRAGRSAVHVPPPRDLPPREGKIVGAGDAFAASLMVTLLRGGSVMDAVRTAVEVVAARISAQAGTVATLGPGPSPMNVVDSLATRAGLDDRLREWRRAGHRIVFTNGCFDLLHEGHIRLLHRARAAGDRLIVGVNDDESVRHLKGAGRPVVGLAARISVLAAVGSVDLVVPFGGPTAHELIRRVRPHVYVKGGDYRPDTLPEADVLRALGTSVRIVGRVPGRSTTGLIEQLRLAR